MDNLLLKQIKDKRNIFINYCLLNEKKIDNNCLFASKNKKLEAVLIELRTLPHLSFLIKNAIYRLGNEWSFTIICGLNNYDFIKNIVSKIKGYIRIIKLDKLNLTREEYSIMLLNSKFWKQFKGEKILIYQEDSIIFKKLDPKFLKYDFIGAPYPNKEIGNGGLSLRTKNIMIKICEKFFDLYETNLIEKSQIIKKYKPFFLEKFGDNYFNNNEYYFLYALEKSLLEDLQITNRMKYHNIGILPDFNTAIEFSSEKFYHNNPFGGHQFWYCMKDITIWLDKNLFR